MTNLKCTATTPELRISILLFFALFAAALPAQPVEDNRLKQLALQLEEYAAEYPKIDKQIDIAVTGSLQEFAIAFSKETKLNLVIDPAINQRVVVNFAETKPRDILLYLCKFYNLDLSLSGSILALIPLKSAPPPPKTSKPVQINYNSYNEKLELNLQNDTLDEVLKRISELTTQNIIATKAVSREAVSGYVGPASLEDALEQMAKRNELTVFKTDKDYYVVDKQTGADASPGKQNNLGAPGREAKRGTGNGNRTDLTGSTAIQTIRDSLGNTHFTIHAQNVPIANIIRQAANDIGQNLVFYTEPTEPVTIQVDSVSFEQMLNFVFNGTRYGYTIQDGIYFVGDRKSEGVRQSIVHQLQHRSVKAIVKYIPKDVLGDLYAEEFVELNALILSGSPTSIQQTIEFLKGIDKPVPVVNIELTIVDVSTNADVRVGLEAGMGTRPVEPGGLIYPGIDFTFSSEGINNLLNTLANNNIINLGQVKPNFYASLQAIEDNGYANINSKPRLSTINGQEAVFTIGETRYYEVQRTTLQGNQTPISLQDKTFQSVNADFTIRILPVIAGDENVTLEIEVKQSDFIGQVTSNAPPAQVNRSFVSNIRIKNQEMIVLGGLESKSVSGNGRGIPVLSRIPVLKWLFGKQRRTKEKSRLLIFIKPSIIY